MNLVDLETFVLAAEAGTFAAAAERLGVPRSTVSRRVSRLEDALGRQLLARTARSLTLTDDGRALLSRSAPALREIAEVERDLGDRHEDPRGRIRVTASLDLSTSDFLSRLLAAFTAHYPRVQVELEVTSRLVDLKEEGFDLAFRTHSGPLPDRDDLVARRLGPIAFGLYASPDDLARHGVPRSLDDLAHRPTVCHGRAMRSRWPVVPTLTVDDYGALAVHIAAGAGLGALPDFVAAPLVARGVLVPVGLPWEVPEARLSLLWLRSRHLAPRVRAFIDLATEHAEDRALDEAAPPLR